MNFLNLILLIFCALVMWYLYNGAIYVPTDKLSLATIVQFATAQPGRRVADLGSGDGRVVIALAQAGAQAVGFENNPLLFIWSWVRIKRLALPNAQVHLTSFWGQNLADFDVVVVFGMTHIMARLQQKLARELRPEARVISNVFRFPGWVPQAQAGMVRVYQPKH